MENQKDNKLTRKEKKALKKQNRASADKKGMLLIIALAAVATALLINAVSLYNKGPVVDEPDTTVSQDVVVTVPSTTQPTTLPTQPTVTPTTDNQAQESTGTTEKAEDPKQEILDKVAQGVNSLKNEKGTIKAVKTQSINLKLTECSLPTFVGVVNTVLDFFAGETVTEYTFTDGKGTDSKGNEIELKNSIPPTSNESKEFCLTIDGVADAWTTKEGENTVYTIVVVPETSTMANPRPPYHNSAGDTFDCTKVDLPVGEITKADFDYPGSQISVTYSPDGRVVRYHQILRINGVGEGAAMGMSASGRIEGNAEETWDITY